MLHQKKLTKFEYQRQILLLYDLNQSYSNVFQSKVNLKPNSKIDFQIQQAFVQHFTSFSSSERRDNITAQMEVFCRLVLTLLFKLQNCWDEIQERNCPSGENMIVWVQSYHLTCPEIQLLEEVVFKINQLWDSQCVKLDSLSHCTVFCI